MSDKRDSDPSIDYKVKYGLAWEWSSTSFLEYLVMITHCRCKPKVLLIRRCGNATVELAVMLPILVVLVFGTIEACSMIYKTQTLHIAAYEGCRLSLVPKSTTAQVEFAANRMLLDRRIQGTSITISPLAFSTANIGTKISVTVTAPANSNTFVPSFFFAGRTLTGSCHMMKEY